jgi:hypothetical protein
VIENQPGGEANTKVYCGNLKKVKKRGDGNRNSAGNETNEKM